MVDNKRLIAPYLCECCGAPLNPNIKQCTYCQTYWNYVERYRGPEIPEQNLQPYNNSIFTGSAVVSSFTMLSTQFSGSTSYG